MSKKRLDERLLMRDVADEVMRETYIGEEIVVENTHYGVRDGYGEDRYKVRTIDGYYPGFVLTVDGNGFYECFDYYEVWKTLYKHI